ncbi:Asp-tRNA(Asn)/Glu-tRNA(Gln) amidotransferase subunit GatC [Litorivicinus sp.]|nr:Asp-tRNA(Asn)/Glu-tRNA(Gln) amidotransferase subunit GatC [Litorivicinus sp.]MDB9861859.1 Asp-tRNA(Asn)/Glu-tRNA(Gln) amidotransferase subunit GatC [Litorivicinus sp.]MDC1208070.1 Asp-tRNA(Asn)/Glu-tRNA(Gln) amidotransferase subunit GatC [Litorivicinus sp.]
MSLSGADIQCVAKLARLRLTEAETTSTLSQLNSILTMIDSMQAVITEGVAPLAHPLELTQVLRIDEVTEENAREAYQMTAPAIKDGLYLVPRVVE